MNKPRGCELRKPQIILNKRTSSSKSKENREFLLPTRDIGSPIRLKVNQNPSIESPAKSLSRRKYAKETARLKSELLDIIEGIKKYTARLDELYGDKVESNTAKAKLLYETSQLEKGEEMLHKELESINVTLNRKLEVKLNSLKVDLSQEHRLLKQQRDQAKQAFEQDIEKMKARNNEAMEQQAHGLEEQLRLVDIELAAAEQEQNSQLDLIQSENTARLLELGAEASGQISKLEADYGAQKDTLKSLVERKQELVHVNESSIAYIENLQHQINAYKDSKQVASITIDDLMAQMCELRLQIDEQTQVETDWLEHQQQHREAHQAAKAKMRKNRSLDIKTEYEIQNIINKLRCFVWLSTPQEGVVDNDGVSATLGGYEVSKILNGIDETEFFDEFQYVFKAGFRSLKTSVILVGEVCDPKMAARLLKVNWYHIQDDYVRNMKPKGWECKFSLQYLGVSLTKNKFIDLLDPEVEALILIGKSDVAVEATEITLSSSTGNEQVFDELLLLQMDDTVPLILFHIKGTNLHSSQFIDSTSYIFDLSGGDTKHWLDDTLNYVAAGNYDSSLFEHEIFAKQLLHSLYATTESVTAINIRSTEADFLSLGAKINSIKSPSRKRTQRSPKRPL